jgi:hypothetical protein
MSDFIERVSRALCQSAGHDPDGRQKISSGEEENWTFFVQGARAALQAMQEPTQAMIDAARDDILLADASEVWRRMIATALASKAPA